MLHKVYSAAVIGLDAEIVEVETDISSGLPATIVVGLPDAAIRESRERVKSALKHAGCTFPRSRVAINLAPADLPKIGSHYDLPIAISILVSSTQLSFDTKDKLFIGELALDGALRPVPGALVVAEAALRAGFKTLFVPEENAAEAALLSSLEIIPVKDLESLIRMLKGISPSTRFIPEQKKEKKDIESRWDFRFIRGQETAKRALEIAAAGGHNVLMSGPPGSGKTLLARGLATILPKLTYDESLEVTKVYSVAGLLSGRIGLVAERPFRAPHHTSSGVALVGGGSEPRPGEITLAHRGVLFLDEFPEFTRQVLESLRQPLEDGIISVARAARSVTFPAQFILVAAMNPCPCGFSTDPEKTCVCTPSQLIRYQKKVSGPLLDRIDLHVHVPRLSFEKITGEKEEERSVTVRKRVEHARTIQQKRFKKTGYALQTNAEMGIHEIKEFCALDKEARSLVRDAVTHQHMSARSYHRVLKIARTIADLFGEQQISALHVAEALMFRPKHEV